MKEPLYIYGAGGLGREIAAMVRATSFEVAGFFDDNMPAGQKIDRISILGGLQELRNRTEPVNLVIAIGNPAIKKRIALSCASSNVKFPVILHPNAVILDSATVSVGKGTVIQAGCILTTSIDIGDHVLLNLNCTVGHDSTIGNFSAIMPGVNLAGQVKIGEEVWVGSGVNVINRVSIGEKAVIGSGAVVIRDVAPGITAVGVPAKPK